MGDPWFRFYVEVLDDPKVQKLPPLIFQAWVNLMCLSKKHDGILPEITDIAYGLRITEECATEYLSILRARNLIDLRKDGRLEMHNWQGRQYKSDLSTERVRHYRKQMKRFRNVSETVQNRTDTDTEQRKKDKTTPLEDRRVVFRNFMFEQLRAIGIEPVTDKSDWTSLERLLAKTCDIPAFTIDRLQEYFRNYLDSPDQFDQKQGHPIRYFCTNVNRFMTRTNRNGTQPAGIAGGKTRGPGYTPKQ